MSTLLSNRLIPISRVGDFWYQNASPAMKAQVIKLTTLGAQSRVASQMQEAADRLAGNCTVTEENLFYTFSDGDVWQFGYNLQARVADIVGTPSGAFVTIRRPLAFEFFSDAVTALDVDDHILTDEQVVGMPLAISSPDLQPVITLDQAALTPGFVLLIPQGWTPRSIVADGGTLMLLGVHYEAGPGYLKFDKSPLELFPRRQFLCRAASRVKPHIFSYTWQVDDLFTDGRYVVNYYRHKQSIPALELAAAEAAGLVIADISGVILEVHPYANHSTRYILASGKIDVPYAHTQLNVGDVIQAGTVLGGVFRLRSAADGPGWYSAVTWGSGLSMDALCPVQGITFPNTSVTVTGASQDAGGIHIQMPLIGTSAAQTAFWNYVHQCETRTGIYWNSAIGLPNLSATASINPLQFIFQARLASRAFTVELNQTNVGADCTSKLLRFIQREKPLGSIQLNLLT